MHIPKSLKFRFDKISFLTNLVILSFDMWSNHLCQNIEEFSFIILYFISILTFKISKDYTKNESKFNLYNPLHNVSVPTKIIFFINLKLEFIKVNENYLNQVLIKKLNF